MAATGGAKPSVDDVWKRLKQDAKPRAAVPAGNGGAPSGGREIDFDKLWHGFSNDVRRGPVNAGPKFPLQLEVDQLYRSPPPPASASAPHSHATLAAAAGTPPRLLPDATAADQLVTRCVAAMKDTSGRARRKALQDVQVGGHAGWWWALRPRVTQGKGPKAEAAGWLARSGQGHKGGGMHPPALQPSKMQLPPGVLL